MVPDGYHFIRYINVHYFCTPDINVSYNWKNIFKLNSLKLMPLNSCFNLHQKVLKFLYKPKGVFLCFTLGFWVHCNDSKLSMCTMDEVCKAQAYILFYTQRVTENGHSKLLPPELLSGSLPPNEEADTSEIFSWS